MQFSEIETRFHKMVSELAEGGDPEGGFDIDMDITETGVNSINFIKVVISLEGEFGIEFDDPMLNLKKYQNIREILEYVQKKVAEGE